jgi:hypothetical protein
VRNPKKEKSTKTSSKVSQVHVHLSYYNSQHQWQVVQGFKSVDGKVESILLQTWDFSSHPPECSTSDQSTTCPLESCSTNINKSPKDGEMPAKLGIRISEYER